MENNRTIAQEMIIQRAKHGYTQQMLAEKLQTTQRTIAAWESGASQPRKTMCVLIAQVFGLPDDYFLESTDVDRIDNLVEQMNDLMERSGINSSDEKTEVAKRLFEQLTDESESAAAAHTIYK